jgi:hypothetical protein
MLGDELFSVNADRKDLLTNEKILNLMNTEKSARPLDLFEHPDESLIIELLGSPIGLTREIAEIWHLKIDEDTHIIGIFNWGNSGKEIRLDFSKIGLPKKDYELFDLWEEKKIGNYPDSYAVWLDRHASQLIKIDSAAITKPN